MLYQKIKALQHNEKKTYQFLSEKSEYYARSPKEMYAQAETLACNLQAEGVKQGEAIALILESPEAFICGFMGCVLAGAVPVPVSPPNIGFDKAAYLQALSHIVEKSCAKYLFFTESLSQSLPVSDKLPALEPFVYEWLEKPASKPLSPVDLAAEDTCFIQFTSGSTGNPKGVVVSYANLNHNVRGIAENIRLTSEDVSVSWLPLYHDMGLIGKVLTPIYYQNHMIYIPTRKFIRSPSIWLTALSRFKATITFAPNFAFALAVKRFREKQGDQLDLSQLRVLGCGAEPINPDVLDSFCERMSVYGLNSSAIMPCYGMAEATLALTFDSIDTPYKRLAINQGDYHQLKIAIPEKQNEKSLSLVSCGRIFDGHKIRILDAAGYALGEGQVGEVCVEGPSIAKEYINAEEATESTFSNGLLRTGDIGFMYQGELYISGRIKDMIIVNGRNIYAQDVEWPLEIVEGIRQGNTVAISIQQGATEGFVVLAEVKRAQQSIIDQINAICSSHIGLLPTEVLLIQSGALPKTTSGKVRRQLTKSLYLSGVFDEKRLEVKDDTVVG
ncbi:MAG: fatty acyl-AMP ligase [Cellvibrionales bacterium]|nr:fatty acyl-AMP ligase [Cellvibrionales bacterium]